MTNRKVTYTKGRVRVSYPMNEWSKGMAWYHLVNNPPRIQIPNSKNPWCKSHGMNMWQWSAREDRFLNKDEMICHDIIT